MRQVICCVFVLSIILLTTTAQKAEYSEDLAKWLVPYAAVTYCAIEKVANFSCGPCKIVHERDSFELLHYKLAEVFGHPITGYLGISTQKKAIIVAYEGTNASFAQIWQEARFSQLLPFNRFNRSDHEHTKGILISQYFLEAFKSLNLTEPLLWLQGHKPEFAKYNVYFTGHSLGGAIATIATLDYAFAAEMFAKQQLVTPQLYTFGAPRVGNYETTLAFDHFNISPFRIVNKNDLVPHVPPCKKSSILPIGECERDLVSPFHFPTEVWYKEDEKNYKICAGGEDLSCSNSRGFYNLFDHFDYLGFKISGMC